MHLCWPNSGIPRTANMPGEESLQIVVGTEGDSIPLMEFSSETDSSDQSVDYVLVADISTQRNQTYSIHTPSDDKTFRRQKHFLDEKGFRYKVRKDGKKVFFGIQADSRIFTSYHTLLKNTKGPVSSGFHMGANFVTGKQTGLPATQDIPDITTR
ncbi:anoctamin-9-like [Rhynchonycteris naso]